MDQMVGTFLPWRHWCRLLRDDKSDGIDAVACAVRAYSIDDGGDALGLLWREWCSPLHSADSALATLLLVVAAVTEAQSALAAKLLQSSQEDAAHDLRLFVQAAEEWRSSDRTLSIQVNALWTQLLGVATAFLASNEANAQVAVAAEPDPSFESLTEDGMMWEEFGALSSALDSCALQKTKDGRAILQEMDEIVALQESLLVHRETTLSSESSFVIGMLREVVQRLKTRLASTEKETTKPPAIPQHTLVSETIYQECENDASVRHYVKCPAVQVGSAVADKDTESNREPVDSVSTLERLASFDLDEQQAIACAAAVLEELSLINELSALSIRVATVLGWQLTTRVLVVNRVNITTRHTWEREIWKCTNSLTCHDARETVSSPLLQLLRYAALDPATVIDVVLTNAMTTTHHHQFFGRLLWWCPMLLRWQIPSEEPFAPSQFITTLVHEMTDLVNARDAANPIEDAAVFQFLLVLSVKEKEILEADTVMNSILWKTLDALTDADNSRAVARLFEIAHRFLRELRECNRQCSSEQLIGSFTVVCEQYKRYCDPANSGHIDVDVDFRDVALLLTQDTVTSSSCASRDDWCPGIAMQTLLETHGALLSVSDEEEQYSSPSRPITSALSASIQHCLWSLVWATKDTTEHTRFSVQLAHTMVCGFVDPSGSSIDGASVVQTEVTKMLLASGWRSFDWILTLVEVVILPLLHEAKAGGSESPSSSTASENNTRHLTPETPVEVMVYAVRCWCIGAFTAGSDIKTETVLRMLDRTLRPIDHAIESAAGDPSTLSQCLQVIGLVQSWLCTKRDFAHAQRLLQRVEIAAVRVLFLLAQLPSDKLPSHKNQASFRVSIATVLSSTRLLESDAVTRFLHTTVRSPY